MLTMVSNGESNKSSALIEVFAVSIGRKVVDKWGEF